MKPKDCIEISYDLHETTLLGEALPKLKFSDIYELRVNVAEVVNALRIVNPINSNNVGTFIKVTIDWDYKWDEWSVRCKEGIVWSAGA